MLRTAHYQRIAEIIAALLIVLFGYTALSKWEGQAQFAGAMAHSVWLAPYRVLLSWLVPAAETGVVVLLLIPQTRRLGLLSAAVMMGLFTIYVITVLGWADRTPCTCGGVIEQMSWSQHLVFNSVFFFLSILAIVLYPRKLFRTNK